MFNLLIYYKFNLISIYYKRPTFKQIQSAMNPYQVVLHHNDLPQYFQQYKQRFQNNMKDFSFGRYTCMEKLSEKDNIAYYKGYMKEPTGFVIIKITDLKYQKVWELDGENIYKQKQKTKSRRLMMINSQRFIKYLDCYQDQTYKLDVMQHCDLKCTLKQKIQQTRKFDNQQQISEQIYVKWIKQIVQCFSLLYSKNIYPKSISAENFVVKNDQCRLFDLDLRYQYLNGFNKLQQQSKKQIVDIHIHQIAMILYQLMFGSQLPQTQQIIQNTLNVYANRIALMNGGGKKQINQTILDFLQKSFKLNDNKFMNWYEFINHKIFVDKEAVDVNKFMKYVTGLTRHMLFNNNNDLVQNNVQENQQQEIHNAEEENQLTKRQKLDQQSLVNIMNTQTILNKIIIPIQQENPFDPNNRNFIEMMYLISVRCWKYLLDIKNFIKNNQHTLTERYFRDKINVLQDKINQVKDKYSNILTQKQNQKLEISKDWVMKALSKMYIKTPIEEKNRFLTGFEGLDYTRQQQIKYTEQYINYMLAGQKYEFDTKESISKYLKAYGKICSIKFKDVLQRGYKCLILQI